MIIDTIRNARIKIEEQLKDFPETYEDFRGCIRTLILLMERVERVLDEPSPYGTRRDSRRGRARGGAAGG